VDRPARARLGDVSGGRPERADRSWIPCGQRVSGQSGCLGRRLDRGRISAAQARRLACDAGILPAELGGHSEVLDLGRTRRLFSPAQRKALAIRDRTCRAEGCDIPAAWCEAHHAAKPWSREGRTDLKDGLLLCRFHHHRAHDQAWRADRLTDGRVRFHRRT